MIARSGRFAPLPADAAGVVSWVHIGDLHLTTPAAQNASDLISIVDEINRTFAGRISFVFLPGDVAEHGLPDEFAIASRALGRLRVPWCAIVGDHDVQQRTFAPFLDCMNGELHFAFRTGNLDFLAMNAFDMPAPDSFCVAPEQLRWAEAQLDQAASAARRAVVLLHCYPSDLKRNADEASALVRRPGVLLVEMGHTHYNEVANDGRTLYIATRSTGQIEEGPVGFSVTNIDGEVVSWRFIPLQSRAASEPVVMITTPADERFLADRSLTEQAGGRIRAKVWSETAPVRVVAHCAGSLTELQPVPESAVWEGELPRIISDGVHALRVTVEDARGAVAHDEIRILIGAQPSAWPVRAPRDQDNPLAPWPERGLLGTQLGPNKNGRKW